MSAARVFYSCSCINIYAAALQHLNIIIFLWEEVEEEVGGKWEVVISLNNFAQGNVRWQPAAGSGFVAGVFVSTNCKAWQIIIDASQGFISNSRSYSADICMYQSHKRNNMYRSWRTAATGERCAGADRWNKQEDSELWVGLGVHVLQEAVLSCTSDLWRCWWLMWAWKPPTCPVSHSEPSCFFRENIDRLNRNKLIFLFFSL